MDDQVREGPANFLLGYFLKKQDICNKTVPRLLQQNKINQKSLFKQVMSFHKFCRGCVRINDPPKSIVGLCKMVRSSFGKFKSLILSLIFHLLIVYYSSVQKGITVFLRLTFLLQVMQKDSEKNMSIKKLWKQIIFVEFLCSSNFVKFRREHVHSLFI